MMKMNNSLIGRKFKNNSRGYVIQIVEVKNNIAIGYEVTRLAVDTKVHRIGRKVLENMEEIF